MAGGSNGSSINNSSSNADSASSPFRAPEAQAHALREHTFLRETETRLDDFLAQGREVLDGLVDQRNVLKGTQRRLLDAANTMGLSRDVIGWIERRRCVCVFIVFCLCGLC